MTAANENEPGPERKPLKELAFDDLRDMSADVIRSVLNNLLIQERELAVALSAVQEDVKMRFLSALPDRSAHRMALEIGAVDATEREIKNAVSFTLLYIEPVLDGWYKGLGDLRTATEGDVSNAELRLLNTIGDLPIDRQRAVYAKLTKGMWTLAAALSGVDARIAEPVMGEMTEFDLMRLNECTDGVDFSREEIESARKEVASRLNGVTELAREWEALGDW